MQQLKGLLEQPSKRNEVIEDCVQVIEAEVRSKSGLTGIAVKTAFGVVKALKPGIIRESVDGLLDEFVDRVDPFVAAYQQDGKGGLKNYLVGRADDVAESLLGVTDRRAERATNKALVKAYKKLRPKGKEHVLAAVPRVGGMLERHITSS